MRITASCVRAQQRQHGSIDCVSIEHTYTVRIIMSTQSFPQAGLL
jgi:hypothetical protein